MDGYIDAQVDTCIYMVCVGVLKKSKRNRIGDFMIQKTHGKVQG